MQDWGDPELRFSLSRRSLDTGLKQGSRHTTEYHTALLIERADCMLEMRQRHLSLVDGSVVLIPPATDYTLQYGSVCTYYRLFFRPAADKGFNAQMQLLLTRMYEKRSSVFVVEDGVHASMMCACADVLYRVLREAPEVGEEFHVDYVRVSIYKLILDLYYLQQKYGALCGSESDAPLGRQVAAYIDRHFLQDMSLKALANLFFLSREHLCRLFKKEMRVTVLEYIHRKRLEYACDLLSNTENPIADICFESGFGSLQRFFMVFQKYLETTPGAYRRLYADSKRRGLKNELEQALVNK